MVVFGRGNRKASLIICGEAPGRNEDMEGKPFIGRSGVIVDKMLEASNIKRKKIFITNVCLCRTPNKRKPTLKEIKACFPRLKSTLRQIGQYVILMGSTASRAVLKKPFWAWGEPYWAKAIGKWVVPVKHPGWYLRPGNQKYLAFGINEFVDAVKSLRKLSRGLKNG